MLQTSNGEKALGKTSARGHLAPFPIERRNANAIVFAVLELAH